MIVYSVIPFLPFLRSGEADAKEARTRRLLTPHTNCQLGKLGTSIRRMKLANSVCLAATRLMHSGAKQAQARARAALTRFGVSGYSRIRTPVASKKALAIAAAAGPTTSSPAPLDF